MDSRQQTALAFGIAEWANAMDHLRALDRIGEKVPTFTMARIERELQHLADQWPGAWPRHVRARDRVDGVVDEAGKWLVDHQDELTDLLEQPRTRRHV